MTISENDKVLLNLWGISEKDFEKLSEADQEKTLSQGFSTYKKKRKIQTKPELIENAKKELPKIKELFQKQTLVYANGVAQNTGRGEYILVGYLSDKKKVLLVNPNAKTETLKVHQADDDQIITSAE